MAGDVSSLKEFTATTVVCLQEEVRPLILSSLLTLPPPSPPPPAPPSPPPPLLLFLFPPSSSTVEMRLRSEFAAVHRGTLGSRQGAA